MGNVTRGVVASVFCFTMAVCAFSWAESPRQTAVLANVKSAKTRLARFINMDRATLAKELSSAFEECEKWAGCAEPWEALAFREDFALAEKTRLLLGELKTTCAKEKKFVKFRGDEVDATLVFKRGIIKGIANTGKETAAAVKKAMIGTNKGDEYRQWLVVALGELGESSIAQELLEQSVSATEYFIRADSVRALYGGGISSEMSAAKILPFLRTWVQDPFFIAASGSCGKEIPGGRIYPVRDEALSILLSKKIKYKRDQNEITLVE